MSFLKNTESRLRDYKRLAEKAMAQISDEALLDNPEGIQNNSLVVIVKHMHGNMLSRFTNFLTEDGEKPWRNRDEEFVYETTTRESLMEIWEAGWNAVFNALSSLSEADLVKTIHIRGEALSVMDAIIRQLMHYAYHIGQIVHICKEYTGDSWHSLSIPLGGSQAFNAQMQGGEKTT